MGGEGWKEKKKGWRVQMEISFGVNLKRLEETAIESLIRADVFIFLFFNKYGIYIFTKKRVFVLILIFFLYK